LSVTANRRGLIIPGAFSLLAFLVLVGLGSWQIERLYWKQDVIAALTQRLAADPVDLPPSAAWAGLTQSGSEFLRVRFRAEFRGPGTLVYTSGSALRDDVKTPGYFVFMPAGLTGGGQVAVNRGYSKERLAAFEAGSQDIVGVLRWPDPMPWFVSPHGSNREVWHVRDPELMARELGWGTVAPFYVEQEGPIPPGGVPHPAKLNVKLANNHLQYAVTWYGLAAVLLIIFVIWGVRQGRDIRPLEGSLERSRNEK
jgi:surfeit locus 1 family protein